MQDLDDYYSLTGYAARFVRNPELEVSLYLSERSTLIMIELWEEGHGNSAFRYDQMEYALDAVSRDEMIEPQHLIALLSLSCIAIGDSGDVIADLDIYNDFVAFLTARGINS